MLAPAIFEGSTGIRTSGLGISELGVLSLLRPFFDVLFFIVWLETLRKGKYSGTGYDRKTKKIARSGSGKRVLLSRDSEPFVVSSRHISASDYLRIRCPNSTSSPATTAVAASTATLLKGGGR